MALIYKEKARLAAGGGSPTAGHRARAQTPPITLDHFFAPNKSFVWDFRCAPASQFSRWAV